MEASVLLRLFISCGDVYNTADALYRIHEQKSIFEDTRMGLVIPKEIKYNLHYGDVRGDVLQPPHGTNIRNLPISIPQIDLYNMNAHTIFGENPFTFTQVIVWILKIGLFAGRDLCQNLTKFAH